mmetsp:Transcript_8980/g.13803  ORF Transcript_8980/g.13803 Transcript_8980/m.13803 type:complete len:304 (+) Transcript_8980:135-1046(+)|eukprot:CAMPEP_0178907454 /NCGR_PEP_ID=MMETSP0786-20121207/7383_1 /TAXON_ID=186022 /ORGANISM="Thalassionema frauenfeldii, Strain CCMP 1798" /LENGTH=303 /DNA_ID=CAMNT_0020579261 /DNA_START=52 /DNA_END=963 /DNA_ORIENTATION=-
MMKYLVSAALCNVAAVSGFAGFTELVAFHPSLPATEAMNHAFTELSVKESVIKNPLELYTNTLLEHPLITKMVTGGVLATCGDAIAQSKVEEEAYDTRRAASFAIFDMMYRALQHFAYPVIVAECYGQHINGIFQSIGLGSTFANQMDYMAAMEQTLASQLVIVPVLYYPVFFSLTGYVQGLSTEEAITRAKETFIPLMKRNLLFYIPVQFIQFCYLPTDVQIPFLSVCGLCWTYILSNFAGSVKGYAGDEEEKGMDLIDVKLDTEQQQLANITAALLFEEAALDATEQNEGLQKKEKYVEVR